MYLIAKFYHRQSDKNMTNNFNQYLTNIETNALTNFVQYVVKVSYALNPMLEQVRTTRIKYCTLHAWNITCLLIATQMPNAPIKYSTNAAPKNLHQQYNQSFPSTIIEVVHYINHHCYYCLVYASSIRLGWINLCIVNNANVLPSFETTHRQWVKMDIYPCTARVVLVLPCSNAVNAKVPMSNVIMIAETSKITWLRIMGGPLLAEIVVGLVYCNVLTMMIAPFERTYLQRQWWPRRR